MTPVQTRGTTLKLSTTHITHNIIKFYLMNKEEKITHTAYAEQRNYKFNRNKYPRPLCMTAKLCT